MFGNRIGWGISAAIIVLVSFMLHTLHKRGTQPQSPTAIGENAARWTLAAPIDARSIATWMTEDGDASELYQQVIKHYDANRGAYERFNNRKAEMPEGKRTDQLVEADLKQMLLQRLKWDEYKAVNEGLDLLVKAKNIKRGGVFAKKLDIIVTYDRDLDGKYPEDLAKLMRVANDTAWLVATVEDGAGNKTRHLELLQAIFSLGVHLAEERLLFTEWRAGRTLQGVAPKLALYEQDPARKKLIDEFGGQWVMFSRDRIEPVQKAIFLTTRPHTGDMAALARLAGDHAWRIEGILALGRCKFTGESMGDRVGAKRLLEVLATDDDPRIARAATTARDLPIEEFRKLRLGW